jgi:hypothetical protein
MRRYDDALADFTRAIELDPSHGDYAVKRAEIHQLMGEREGTLPERSPLEQPLKSWCMEEGEVHLTACRAREACRWAS